MNRKELLQFALAQLPEAKQEAEWLCCHYLQLSKHQLWLEGDVAVLPQQIEMIQKALQRRKAGEPLQYILGEQPFMDLILTVTPAVLIPRWDSEVVVEQALHHLPPDKPCRVADVCTGSGALALAVQQARPLAEVWATDISEAALAIAKENAHRHQLPVHFLLGDLLAPLDGPFDGIISNPPYIARGELEDLPKDVLQEPRLALDGGMDGLDFYRRLCVEALSKTKPGGFLLVEIGHGQAAAVCQLWQQAGWQNISWGKDYGGRERYVLGWKPQT